MKAAPPDIMGKRYSPPLAVTYCLIMSAYLSRPKRTKKKKDKAIVIGSANGNKAGGE